MQSFTTEQIINRGEQLGFKYKKIFFSIIGRYKTNDALFNHRDIPHFNHLHKSLAYGYGNEGVHYSDSVSFIRYYKFLGITFPILSLIKDDGKNRVLEMYSFFCFQFLKLNEEIPIANNRCESKIVYHIGCKNKFLLNIFMPFFKIMFTKSFNDYKNDDYPFLNRRAELRTRGFSFNKDNNDNFTYEDCLNIQNQNCFFDFESVKNVNKVIKLNEIKENKITSINDLDILSFQFYRSKNIIKIFPLICPHEGGDLAIDNHLGKKFTFKHFIEQGCKVRCNIHNRRFDPIVIIDLDNKKEIYQSKVYNFKLSNNEIVINIKNDLNTVAKQDWSL